MTIAAHWKVFDRTGQNIDFIERELHKITSVGVLRSEIGYSKQSPKFVIGEKPAASDNPQRPQGDY